MGADLGGSERRIARRSSVAERHGHGRTKPERDIHTQSAADRRAIGACQSDTYTVAHGHRHTHRHANSLTECVRVGFSVPEPD